MYYGRMQIGIFGERKKCDQLANKFYEYAVKLPFLTLTLTESRKNEKTNDKTLYFCYDTVPFFETLHSTVHSTSTIKL